MERAAEPLAPIPQDPAAALEPYDPARGHGPWDARLAAHLLRRALGGGPPERVRQLAGLGAPAAVEQMFPPRDGAREGLHARLGGSVAAAGDRRALAAWWLMKLAQEERAPGNRLALFWHDHFACAHSKVDDLPALYRQHQLFLERGGGPFPELLLAVSRDPAMLRFLDGDVNRRGVANENLAREIFELFSLGVGHYTEQDVREAARALTGCTIRNGRYAFVPEHHDPEEKTLFGQEAHDGADVCRLAALQPACPRFLVAKLWRFYLSPEPPEEAVALLAERWREQGMETGWLLGTLLASRAFFSREAYRSLVKSPVDLLVGTVRTLGSRPDFQLLAGSCDAMGQQLFEPPGVQGWEEGEAWIHSAAWIERANFAAAVSRGAGGMSRGVQVDALVPPERRTRPDTALDALLGVFLQSDLPESRRASLLAALEKSAAIPEVLFAAAVQAVLCLPEFHLA